MGDICSVVSYSSDASSFVWWRTQSIKVTENKCYNVSVMREKTQDQCLVGYSSAYPKGRELGFLV